MGEPSIAARDAKAVFVTGGTGYVGRV